MGLVIWTSEVKCPQLLRLRAASHSKGCVQAHKECKLFTFLCQIESNLLVLTVTNSEFPC